MILFLSLAAALSSCRRDDGYDTPSSRGATLIELSVSASNAGMANPSEDAASAIKSLCILQFNANGNAFGTLKHAGIGRETSPGSRNYSATLLQSTAGEKYKLAVVANYPGNDYSIFQKMMGKTYEDILAQTVSEPLTGPRAVPVFDASHPFPMFGIPENGAPVTIGGDFSPGNVSLVRPVARVDIGIGTKNASDDTWAKNAVPFDMQEIQIWKAGKQYAYMPAEGNFSASLGNLAIDRPSPVAGEVDTKVYSNACITNGTYCAGQIYLPEALTEGDKNSRLAIIIKGSYKGGTGSYYRMDFSYEKPTGEDEVIPGILRNHIYQFTITEVTDRGYDTAEDAYALGQSEALRFNTLNIDAWKPGVTAHPIPIEGFNMIFNGLNGKVTAGMQGTLLEKPEFWKGKYTETSQVKADYNTFYGEVPGNLKRSPAYPNGDIYPNEATLFAVEGVFPKLMVATDDVYSIEGSPSFHWKDGLILSAFEACRTFSGLGYSDWRLPRASELYLMFLNKGELNKQRGFTALEGTYWSGSEKDDDEAAPAASQAWAVDFDAMGAIHLKGGMKTSDSYKVRCVRQLSDATNKMIEP